MKLIYANQEVDLCNTRMYVNFLFVDDSMLPLPDQAFFIKIFYITGESVTDGLEMFRMAKGLKLRKWFIIIGVDVEASPTLSCYFFLFTVLYYKLDFYKQDDKHFSLQ